ncbi:MAG TPA: hypothetical protein VN794_04075 [Methylomirabilota bacterium]|jgi:hypothetical protein|nr:hypothetical protein [Methylomirabilota bacterium]
MPPAFLAWTVHVPQGSAQGFDLPFIRRLLALGQLQGLEYLFHVIERFFELLDYAIHFGDGFLH